MITLVQLVKFLWDRQSWRASCHKVPTQRGGVATLLLGLSPGMEGRLLWPPPKRPKEARPLPSAAHPVHERVTLATSFWVVLLMVALIWSKAATSSSQVSGSARARGVVARQTRALVRAASHHCSRHPRAGPLPSQRKNAVALRQAVGQALGWDTRAGGAAQSATRPLVWQNTQLGPAWTGFHTECQCRRCRGGPDSDRQGQDGQSHSDAGHAGLAPSMGGVRTKGTSLFAIPQLVAVPP